MHLPHQSRMTRRSGLTMIEAIVILVVMLVLASAFDLFFDSSSIDAAKATMMKNRGRGIWVAVVSANAEREASGTNDVWPKDLGFDKSRTSTEYFRLLMSDTNGCTTTNQSQQVASDLRTDMLGGVGVPYAASPGSFTKANNAWAALCVGDDTPSEEPFLVTRNVDIGRVASASSAITLKEAKPFGRERAVWVTRGGGIFDTRTKFLTNSLHFGFSNATYDVMYP